MQELSISEIESVGGAMTAIEAAGLILGFAALGPTAIILGIAIGASGSLLIADYLAH